MAETLARVAAGEDERDRLPLDRGRLGVALVRDDADELGHQPEVVERHGVTLLGALPPRRGPVRALGGIGI